MGGYVQNFLCPRAAYAAEEYIEKVPETSGVSQTVTAEDGVTQTIGTLCSGGKQVVNSGGTGIVSTIVHEHTIVNQNGKQVVNSGGTGTVITQRGGEQLISAGGTGTVIIQRGGSQRVYSGGTGTVITADNGAQAIETGGTGTVITNNGGDQQISGGTGTVITMNGRRESYGQQNVYGGTGIVSTMNGGLQTIYAGGTGTVEIMDGGTQTLFGSCSGSVKTMNGGWQNVSTYCSGNVETMNGGMVKVQAFSNVDVKTMNDGYVNIAGGTCNVTTVNGGSVGLFYGETNIAHFVSGTMSCYQAVTNIGDVYPGVVFILDHNTSNFKQNSGTQTIHSGATVKNFEFTGGTQVVLDGAVAEETVVSEYGSLIVEAGGKAVKTDLNGGTISVDDDAFLQIAKATSGNLNLLYTGGAVAEFGDKTTHDDTFTLTNLSAAGDRVILGHGDKNGWSKSNTLKITNNMSGNADFVINTDLAHNNSDQINIANTVDGGANTIGVNYDPLMDTAAPEFREIVPGSPVVFANTDANANFVGKAYTLFDFGGGTYSYVPDVERVDVGGSRFNWNITKLHIDYMGHSQLIKNGLGNRAYMLGRWRDGNADMLKRLSEVRHGNETGIWASITRGNQKAHGNEFNVNGTYTTINVGFDRATGHGWTVGGAVSHSMGSEGYEKGSGESRMTTLNGYAMWQAKDNHFAEFTARIGQLKSDYFSTGNSGTAHANGITSWGQSLSAAYGMRFNRADGWVFEPKAEFTWAHLNGAGYMADERTRAYANRANSALASLGMHIGKFVDTYGYVYLDMKLVHDFAGGVGIGMYNGSQSIEMADDIRGTWLDTMIGYRYKTGPCDMFVEGGFRAGGSGVGREWQYRLGFNWAF